MIRRPPRSTQSRSSAASDVYKRQLVTLFGGQLGQSVHDAALLVEGDELAWERRAHRRNGPFGRLPLLRSRFSPWRHGARILVRGEITMHVSDLSGTLGWPAQFLK